jgi:hypothetical protein
MKKVVYLLILALLLCLAPMPYGYYMFVRYFAMIVFCILACQKFAERSIWLTVVFGAAAVLFQPFFKIALGRGIWCIVDAVIAVALVVLCYKRVIR